MFLKKIIIKIHHQNYFFEHNINYWRIGYINMLIEDMI